MKRVGAAICGVVVVVELLGCMGDQSGKLEYRGYAPLEGSDGWEISSPENESMDPAMVESAFRLVYEDGRFVMARSLLVIRNGRLVAEAYPHDEVDRWEIQNIQSCTKSFTSILTGIALSRGFADSLTEPLASLLPEEFGRHPDKNISIRDAL